MRRVEKSLAGDAEADRAAHLMVVLLSRDIRHEGIRPLHHRPQRLPREDAARGVTRRPSWQSSSMSRATVASATCDVPDHGAGSCGEWYCRNAE